jgi:uncharacterized protein (TIGR03086 family)
MSENLRNYTKAIYTVDGVVRRLGESDWDKPSPNEEWSARETLGHVIWGMRRIANAVRGQDPPAEQAEADVAGEHPEATWTEARDNLLEALDHRGVLHKEITTPFGTMTVDQALGAFFSDPLTHAWDIAKAAGIDAAIPPELSRRALMLLTATGDALRGPGRLADPVEVDEAASDVDKFIAFTGRDPR